MTATQDDKITELQRANTELRQELDAALAREATLAEELATRAAALAQRNSEYGERIEQQSATIDVLKAMSGSPGDPQPVFDLIAERTRAFCEADGVGVAMLDGELLHLQTHHGMQPVAGDYEALFPLPVSRGTMMGRAILARDAVRVRDTQADPDFVLKAFTTVVSRSMIAVPMLRSDTPIGVIALGRNRPGDFTTAQVELLETFAEQAVIAITSAETYRALQTRTSALQETLEYRTATSDVLNVISRSTFDLQPVLETVVQTSARLCNADRAAIFRREGDLWRLAVNFGFPPAWEDYIRAQGAFSLDRFSEHAAVRAVVERRPVHIDDMAAVPGYGEVRLGEQRTTLGVPLLREGEAIGTIVLARLRVEPFTDRQIELVSTFADQAVIAIENTRLITEQREALEQQTATAEVLQVINASPGDLTPVFDAMLGKAHNLCGVTMGALLTYDGDMMVAQATRGYSEQLDALVRQPRPLHLSELVQGERFLHIPDIAVPECMRGDFVPMFAEQTGARTYLAVALRKDGRLIGMISAIRTEIRPFSDKEITLLENFAAQAVIAMENARLITEQREALEQQTATAEMLQVINTSPGNLAPVFDAMLQKATDLCAAAFGILWTFDDEHYHANAFRNVPPAYAEFLRDPPPATPLTPLGRIAAGEAFAHIADIADEIFAAGGPLFHRAVEFGGFRTMVGVALRKDAVLLGAITIYRQEVRPFSDKQIVLLQNFAAQAVVAMENARLLDEIRQRQEELHITFENMGDGVAMFDETQHLVAWNRKFQDILNVPDDIIARRQTYSEYVRYLAERGEFGPDTEEQVRQFVEQAGRSRTYERTRPDGRAIEVRHNPVPDGGFVLIYADITERKRSEAEIRAARDAAEEAGRTIEAAYRDLKAAQANLIQTEKMASLGQLTAGIAHEIKNPLNFVNNFAALSVDLLSELKETAAPGFAALTDDRRIEIEDVSAMLTSNLEKITEHGKRADGIVKAMLEHSRGSSAERRMVDLNAVIDEALNLAYHGARAQDQSFNITLERDFGEGIAPIEVNPQDMTRVFLNIFSNGFYAATKRARAGGDAGFVPTLKVTTHGTGDTVEIRVRDNGTGIPADIRDKLFQPFFTTKPTGEGTGLGLSITYDIVTKAHGGSIAVNSKVGDYSEFTIRLPRNL